MKNLGIIICMPLLFAFLVIGCGKTDNPEADAERWEQSETSEERDTERSTAELTEEEKTEPAGQSEESESVPLESSEKAVEIEVVIGDSEPNQFTGRQVSLPEEIKEVLLPYFRENPDPVRRNFFEAENILLDKENTYVVLLKSTSGGNRHLLVLKKSENVWQVSTDAISDEDMQNALVSIYKEYSKKPDESERIHAEELLSDPEFLSSCFPEAGSTPEAWKENMDKLEITVSIPEDYSEIVQLMTELYGVSLMKAEQCCMLAEIKEKDTIDPEKWANLVYFLEDYPQEKGILRFPVLISNDGRTFAAATPYTLTLEKEKEYLELFD